jgi:hypothetical protein
LLLGATDRAIGLVERFAECFTDGRAPELVEHEVGTMVGQRIFGIALGYEDLIDHHQLRHDPTMAVLAGDLAARRQNCAPLARKSTLNRLELGGAELTRYHRIAWDGGKIEALFGDLFLEAHRQPPKQIILDLDATDDPLHGHQKDRFFQGYYNCYCYLPLYIFCGPHLLAAKQQPTNIDAAAGAVEETARIAAQIAPVGTKCASCCGRFGACPRGADDVVRAQWRRFSVWPGQELARGRRDRRRARGGRGGEQKPAASRRAGSRTSNGRRATAGAASAASSPRPSGREAPPTRA